MAKAKNDVREQLVEILKRPAAEWGFKTDAEKVAWVADQFAVLCDAVAKSVAPKRKPALKKAPTPFIKSSR